MSLSSKNGKFQFHGIILSIEQKKYTKKLFPKLQGQKKYRYLLKMNADYERYLYLRRIKFTTVVYVTTVALILLSIFQWMPLRYL